MPHPILSVALPVPIPKTFDYLTIDDVQDTSALVGCRVKVAFGPRFLTGMVTAVKETSDAPIDRLKKIASVLDQDPLLDSASLELATWLAKETVCSLGEAVFALLPPGEAGKNAPITEYGTDWHDAGPIMAQESGFDLTRDQKSAADLLHRAIYGEGEKVFLLKGVAAAGKTEVYLSAIKDVLTQGKSALYLAPEIGLVMQFAEIFKARFGEKNVTAWHSGISLKERKELWWKIKSGEIHVVVGARSAALLPMAHLGLIVVDEEQDSAWKEDQKPRFHVRDLVRKRAELSSAALIYGTATPSLELYQDVLDQRVQLIELNERVVKASAPTIRLINRKIEKGRGIFSNVLEKAISDRLQKKEQTILFLNRRGFNRYCFCPNCDWIAKCEKCGVTLVQHKNQGLVCHYCQSHYPIPSACPSCKHKKLVFGGTGTERVMEEIKEKFPWARAARWDRDSVKKKGEQEKIFQDFRAGDLDIIVGTQLVAQGFHFPKVTLVGVVDADVPLHIPDFRAAEHTFQLVTQVAGRAGRDLVAGDVLVQTRNAEHDALQFAARMNFQGFAEKELSFRDALRYPPFTRLIRIETLAKDPVKVDKDMATLLAWINNPNSPIVGVLGPAPARRLRKGVRPSSVLLKVPKAVAAEFLDRLHQFYTANHSRFWIDVDPA